MTSPGVLIELSNTAFYDNENDCALGYNVLGGSECAMALATGDIEGPGEIRYARSPLSLSPRRLRADDALSLYPVESDTSSSPKLPLGAFGLHRTRKTQRIKSCRTAEGGNVDQYSAASD